MKQMFFSFFWLVLASFGVLHASDVKNLTEKKEVKINYLYKIVSPEEWQESLFKTHVVASQLDKNFIHLATEDQVPHVVQKFWHGKNHIILKLDLKKTTGRLVLETNPGGTTQYYHLYQGKIPLEAVVGISEVSP